MNFSKSEKLFREASQIIPGGVNSPVRAFKSVGINPLYIQSGKEGHIFDVDGNEYIDLVSSWGPLITGHANVEIQEAIVKELALGTSFGACNEKEVEMARLITKLFPSIEKVRMVNSGTEATMSAVRLARGFTGKDKIVKFDGCYHGHSDSFLIKAGSGLATFSVPGSSGVTKGTAADTLIANFNNIESVKSLIKEHKGEIAAIILEPIMGNMGIILPKKGFLEELRAVTKEENIVLIFDEVITGFRLSPNGAQGLFNIDPDLTCLGKIIGGGLPVGAFGGKSEIMNCLSPDGPVYQAGTLSGNPLALAAGIRLLKQLSAPGFYESLEAKSIALEKRMREAIAPYKEHLTYNRIGSLSTLFFKSGGVNNADDAREADTDRYALFFRLMLNEGVYMAPSQFEALFVSQAHTDEDMDKLMQAVNLSLKKLF